MTNIDQFNNLRQAILDVLIAEETTIQEAYFEQRSDFDGSPAAVVNVASNNALYNSNKVDRLEFVFQITIYIPLKNETDSHEVETNMGRAYWEVLNMFNQRNILNPHADIVTPTPSSWGWITAAEGIYRFSEITLRCVLFHSNTPKVGS